jgi:hypothetical protein
MTDTEKAMTTQYPEASLLIAIAQSVWQGSFTVAKMELPLSARTRVEFLKITGNDIQTVFITDSDVRYIKKQHGQGEALRGQADITPADFAFIPLVLNEFDTMEYTDIDKKGNKKILFKKKIDSLVYLATIERGPHKREVRTLWKTP